MTKIALIRRSLPQEPTIEVFVPNYKEPILPVNHGGFGWYGLQAYNEQGQLMCHECGIFRDSLGRHIRKHKLSAKQYKNKYGLMKRTKLISENLKNKFRTIANTNHSLDKTPEITGKAILAMNKARKKQRGMRLSLEFLNQQGTCPAQCLSRLIEIAKIEGRDVNVYQVEHSQPRLVYLLATRFGSFNKAKQIAKLILNANDPLYTKQMIIEDMVAFYRKYHRWPLRKDYENGLMICSKSTLAYKNGGLIKLRLEAIELKEIQDARAKISEQIPKFAESIELQYAGRARR